MTIEDLIKQLNFLGRELGYDYKVKYFNPLTEDYEEIELTVAENFFDEDLSRKPDSEYLIVHSTDEILDDNLDDLDD